MSQTERDDIFDASQPGRASSRRTSTNPNFSVVTAAAATLEKIWAVGTSRHSERNAFMRGRSMESSNDHTKFDRLYLKGLGIRYERQRGPWMPIMWHLALRRHTGAMIELADWFSAGDSLQSFGPAADGSSAAGLYRRAYRAGDARAASNAAMSCFNRRDMVGYRNWLRRAARAGDTDAATQLRSFETRLWHGAARKIGRARPKQKRDGLA
ncbi:hypothetical protein [Sphingomonas fennica]|uniref:hypothetical protein n=1 Tax=Edaphosphingomonas fennica TaxID=114404 RepID=UPI0011B21F02|nr:hypothetical protein [Sphingomonas fennica]